VRLAQEALAGWRDLEAESGERLLELTGLIEIVTDLNESSAATLDACRVVWERLDRDQVERRFPLRLPAGSFGVLQPEAGIVRADRALAAFARGIDVHYGKRVDSLAELDAACVVVTAGAWVNDIVQPPLPVRVTRETVCYFRLADARPIPAFVSRGPHSGGIRLYALRDPVHGIKAAAHHAGPKVDPSESGKPDAALVEKVTAWIADHVTLADPHPVETQTCLYTTTSDESFILERRGRTIVGSACSGHGFKFAPAIGARLAALVQEAL
jgi:sarcosine oxidase